MPCKTARSWQDATAREEKRPVLPIQTSHSPRAIERTTWCRSAIVLERERERESGVSRQPTLAHRQYHFFSFFSPIRCLHCSAFLPPDFSFLPLFLPLPLPPFLSFSPLFFFFFFCSLRTNTHRPTRIFRSFSRPKRIQTAFPGGERRARRNFVRFEERRILYIGEIYIHIGS